jgi:hypothetical protein
MLYEVVSVCPAFEFLVDKTNGTFASMHASCEMGTNNSVRCDLLSVTSAFSVAIVGMPLPTLMHRRVVSWKPPADVVAVGSKNETHQESEAHQVSNFPATLPPLSPRHSALSIPRCAAFRVCANARTQMHPSTQAGEEKKIQDHSSLSTIKNEEIEFARGEAEYGRQGSSVTRKTGHLADTEANEMSVKADLMSSGTSKDQSLVESKQVGPGAAGQASDVSVEEGSQLSKFEPVHAVDARSEKEEQGRELLSEIFPDRLGPN